MGCAYRYDLWQIATWNDTTTFNPILFIHAMQFAGYYEVESLAVDTGISEQNLRAIRDGLKQPTDIELGQISQATGVLPSFFSCRQSPGRNYEIS